MVSKASPARVVVNVSEAPLSQAAVSGDNIIVAP